MQAFHHWEAQMRSRSRNFPLCPQCNSPTPLGELARWTVCSLCVTKQW
jgi:predicted nucleic acid-binding Zn ribbon protein